MDEDDGCKALRQVVEERCPGAKFKDSDIKTLVEAGYDTETALVAASKASLDRILSTRPGVVDPLFKAFVQPAERGAMDLDYLDKRIREIAEVVVENRPNKIARRGTAFTSVAVGDVAEEALWKAEVQETRVSCRIVDVDELLVPERALVADLRYLRLQSVGRTTSLIKVVEMKRQRLKQAHDLERCYYSPSRGNKKC